MNEKQLSANTPLGAFLESKKTHEELTARVKASFGDLEIAPFGELIALTRREERSMTLNLRELEWLHSQLGRLLGR